MQELGHIIELLMYLYDSRYATQTTNEEVQKLLGKLCSIEAIKQKIQSFHEGLPPDTKKKLEKCLKNF